MVKMEDEKDDEPRVFKSDEEILNYVKEQIALQVGKGEIKAKVGDLLKIMEIQKQLATETGADEKFWQEIEKIRQEELGDDPA
jgi:hypothetical protein